LWILGESPATICSTHRISISGVTGIGINRNSMAEKILKTKNVTIIRFTHFHARCKITFILHDENTKNINHLLLNEMFLN